MNTPVKTAEGLRSRGRRGPFLVRCAWAVPVLLLTGTACTSRSEPPPAPKAKTTPLIREPSARTSSTAGVQVPVPADFADEANKITDANYGQALEALAEEIDTR